MVPEVFVRSAYNYDRDVVSDDTGINCQVDPVTGEVTPSMAQQHFAEECDINTIVRRFGLNGELPVGVRAPTFADFLDVPDYHKAMNAIRGAQEAFYEMPAEVRARFANDPGQFVAFCSDPANRPEAIKLGLVLEAATELAGPGAPAPAAPTAAGPTAVEGKPTPS